MDEEPNFDEACRLIGRYLHSFSLLEAAIDIGIGLLLGVEGPPLSILSSTIPFAQKVNTLFASVNVLSAIPDIDRKKSIKSLKSDIHRLNESRKLAAHQTFTPTATGLNFQTAVAKDGLLKLCITEWTTQIVDGLCLDAQSTADKVGEIVENMEPYKPSLDFRDPRNSIYIGVL